MRTGLIAAFDLGASFGLGDEAFLKEHLSAGWPTGTVGLKCPLGNGVRADFLDSEELLSEWQAEAAAQLARPELEKGWTTDEGLSQHEHEAGLSKVVANTAIAQAALTIYGLGVAFLEVRFSSVPLEYTSGLLRAYEFAGYRPAIARRLQRIAVGLAEQATGGLDTGLSRITARDLPGVDSDDQGYEEQLLIPYFYRLVELVRPEDYRQAEAAASRLESGDMTTFGFAYHGELRAGTSTIVLESRTLRERGPSLSASEQEESEEDIVRMLACIQIGVLTTTALTTIDKLMSQEISSQVGAFVRGGHASGRSLEDLNRLRLLGLAVVRLSDVATITQTAEDQAFLRALLTDVGAYEIRERVSAACDLAYSVQATESEMHAVRRQNILNVIVFLLTTITVLSVLTDAYDFIRDDASLVTDREARARLLLEVVFALGLILAGVLYLVWPSRRGKTPGPPRDWEADGYSDPTHKPTRD